MKHRKHQWIIAIIMILSSSTASGNTTPEPRSTQTTSPLSWRGSIMFNQQEIQLLESAIENSGTDQSGIAPTNKITQEFLEKSLGEKPIAPRFFLSSILYIPNKNWTVWINDQKISHDQNEGDLTVESVNQNQITAIWKTRSLNSLAPNWRNTIHQSKQLSYNEKEGTLRFILKPNQTFDIETMAIVEGKMPERANQNETNSAQPPQTTTQSGINTIIKQKKQLKQIQQHEQHPSITN